MRAVRFLASMAALAPLVAGTTTVHGQDYPSKPVRILTAGVGGSNDVISRLVAQGISPSLGQQVIVDNRPTSQLPVLAAKAPPDGYTVLVFTGGLWQLPLMANVNYDVVRDFVPVTLLTRAPNVVVVHPSLPVKSVEDLIALAKAKPGELNYSSGSTGASSHLSVELFKYMTGANILRIPFSSAQASETSALLTGEVHVAFSSAANVAPYIKNGRLRAIAVTSSHPSTQYPHLPTVASVVPGYESASLCGMLVPAKTPDAIVKRLNQEAVRYLGTADAKTRLLNLGTEAVGSTPEEFAAVMKSEVARLGKMIREVGIRAE